MASQVTSVINPGLASEILLFHLTENGNLALERRAESQFEASFEDNGTIKGPIANPGSIAAVARRGLAIVYGFSKIPNDLAKAETSEVTTKTGGKSAAGDLPAYSISILSPIYNPVAVAPQATSAFSGLAASSDGESNDFVYFLKVKKGGTEPQLVEMVLSNGKTKSPSAHQGSPSTSTKLAALYTKDGKKEKRLLFFQDNDQEKSRICCADMMDNDSTPSRIKGTEYAKPGTPLAATSATRDGKRFFYLYYMSQHETLTRVVGTAWNTWGQYVELEEPSKMMHDTYISTTADDHFNHVFYIPQNADNSSGPAFTDYEDDRDQIKYPELVN